MKNELVYPALIDMINKDANNEMLTHLDFIYVACARPAYKQPRRWIYQRKVKRWIFSAMAKNRFKSVDLIINYAEDWVYACKELAMKYLEYAGCDIKLSYLCWKNKIPSDGKVGLWNFNDNGVYVPDTKDMTEIREKLLANLMKNTDHNSKGSILRDFIDLPF